MRNRNREEMWEHRALRPLVPATPDSDPRRASSRAFPIWAPVLSIAFLLLLSSPSFAVDGSVDVTDNRQNARRGDQTFDTFSRREVVSVGQRLDFSSRLYLDLTFRRLREISRSGSTGQDLETERTTLQPSFLLNYGQRGFRLGLTGSWQDRSGRADVGAVPEQNRYQFGASMDADPTPTTDLNVHWNHSVTEQTVPDGGDRETREHLGVVSADQELPGSWDLGYRYSARSSNLVERDVRQILQSHRVELSGSPGVGDRFTTSWRARSQLFRQEVETGAAGESRVLLIPLVAELTLDDTPEVLDPLEDDPVPVPGLADGDLDDSTPINIGDSATPVREFGGDYRNLQFDLGESLEISGALLYVDRQLLLPELFEWRVFVTDDPEGRTWTELLPGEVSVQYQEFGGVRQGWEVEILVPTAARYFKMVDVKLGESIPDLFVTELEVFRTERTEVARTLEDSQSHRLDASLGYTLSRRVRLGSQTTVRRRAYEDDAQDLDEVFQSFSSTFTRGGFLLTGRYGIHRLWSDTRRNTDVVDYDVTARQVFGNELTTTVGWSLSDDQSSELDRTTETLSLTANWRPTRRLQITQRLSRGERNDEQLEEESTSVVASTTLHGVPFSGLSFDLVRTDRWVDLEAGAGFERFNDTTLSTRWIPVPLVSLSNYVAYQEREKGEWVVRNSVGWSPFPGGDVELRFSGNSFSDTRTDNTRYSAKAYALWRVHPRVSVDGSVESARVELSGEETTPVSTQVHLLWTF